MADTLPPLLSLHQTGPGQYAMRLYDPSRQSIAAALAKLIPDMRSLLLVMPNDMKQFSFEPQQIPLPVNNSPEIVTEESPAPDPMEQAMAIADSEAPPANPKVVRRKPKENTRVSSAESGTRCGRCGGHGRINMAMPDGNFTESSCPVCQGSGEIKRFGKR